MKEKPTPGPWIVRECAGEVFFEVVPESPPSASGLYYICDTCPSSHGCDGGEHIYGGEQEANARLIAAAPELLEALEKALPSLRDLVSIHSDVIPQEVKDQDNKVLATVESAIAKAKGET